MIQVADRLWVGSSRDQYLANNYEMKAVLNVAFDLPPQRTWENGIVCAHVGLVDGPGNAQALYSAALLTLAALVRHYDRVMVGCHKGESRSMSVALMWINLDAGGTRPWGSVLRQVRERTDAELPEPHEAHRAAYDKMDWEKIIALVGKE